MATHEDGCRGCREYEELSRRGFLGLTGLGGVAAFTAPAWLPRVVLADSYQSRDALVVVFLRGAIDGLSAVVPYGDPNYYASGLRPTLSIAPPGGAGGVTDLDGFFGFSPPMASLTDAYQSEQLAIVHATGSPDPSRSHFDAFKIMEFGTPLQPLTLFTGWLGRHLQSTPPIGDGLLRAVAISNLIPQMLAGAPAAVPVPDPANYGFPGIEFTATQRREVFEAAYASADQPLAGAAVNTLDTIDLLATIDFASYQPAGGAVYPNSPFGDALRSAAALIKAEIGVEAATIDKGGWDTHNAQGVHQPNGTMYGLMADLADGLAAFHLDMQEKMGETTLIVMSEFGRRADENGSQGTDHGHGNMMMVMGGNIAGGQVLTDWTGRRAAPPRSALSGRQPRRDHRLPRRRLGDCAKSSRQRGPRRRLPELHAVVPRHHGFVARAGKWKR